MVDHRVESVKMEMTPQEGIDFYVHMNHRITGLMKEFTKQVHHTHTHTHTHDTVNTHTRIQARARTPTNTHACTPKMSDPDNASLDQKLLTYLEFISAKEQLGAIRGAGNETSLFLPLFFFSLDLHLHLDLGVCLRTSIYILYAH